jgi:hypothetical protein
MTKRPAKSRLPKQARLSQQDEALMRAFKFGSENHHLPSVYSHFEEEPSSEKQREDALRAVGIHSFLSTVLHFMPNGSPSTATQRDECNAFEAAERVILECSRRLNGETFTPLADVVKKLFPTDHSRAEQRFRALLAICEGFKAGYYDPENTKAEPPPISSLRDSVDREYKALSEEGLSDNRVKELEFLLEEARSKGGLPHARTRATRKKAMPRRHPKRRKKL